MAHAHAGACKGRGKSACRERGRRIKVGEGELSIRVQRVGIIKSQSFPSNVAGEKKLCLPEGSKASFVGVSFQILWLLSGSSAYLHPEKKKKKKKTPIYDDKRERRAAACWHLCRFCLLF